MAKSYYGYVERDASSQINWATVGKSINDTIQETIALREQKKAEIDQQSREFGKILSDSPQGQHQGANDALFNYSEQAREMMLISNDLLKRGEMNLRQYTLQNQNLIDGTEQVFNAAEKFQESYKVKFERMSGNCAENPDINCSSKLEQFLMADMEDMINFNSHALYINPTNYEVSLAKRKMVDGVFTSDIDSTPGSFLSIASLNQRLVNEYDVFNLNGYLAENAKDIKSFQYDSGGFLIDDPTASKAYKKYRDGITNSILVNPYASVSILTDITKTNPETQQPWDFTFDPEEAKKDKNKVLLKVNPDNSGNPIIDLTKAQEDAVKKQIHANLDVMVKKEKKQLVGQSRGGITAGDKEVLGNFRELNILMSGHPVAQQATIDTTIQNYNDSAIGRNSGETMQEITTDPSKITVSFRTNDTQEPRNIPIYRVQNHRFDNVEHDGKVYDGVFPIDSEGNPTEDVDKYVYIPPYIVAEKLNSYINPERAGQFQADLLTARGLNFRFTGSDDDSFYSKTTAHGARERVVPADINISELVFQEGKGRTPANYAMDELNLKKKTSEAVTWAEKTLDFTLGQLGYFDDAEVEVKKSGRTNKGEVEIEVKKGEETYSVSIPWNKGKNTNEFAQAVEEFYNVLLQQIRAENKMTDSKGTPYTMPDMTKYGGRPQKKESDGQEFDVNSYKPKE